MWLHLLGLRSEFNVMMATMRLRGAAVLLLLVIFSGHVACQDDGDYLVVGEYLEFNFDPPFIEGLVVGARRTVKLTLVSNDSSVNNAAYRSVIDGAEIGVHAAAESPPILRIHISNDTTVDAANNYSIEFDVEGLFLGRTTLQFSVDGEMESIKYPVAVVRPERMVDRMFVGLVMTIVMLGNVGMGCKVDLAVVKEVLRRPIPPLIGFLCQFIIMPVMSFSLVQVFGFTGGLGLGFFATGCSPSGSSSNMYTFLLRGDVSLSVTMTLVSVIASLGMMPLWLMTLGRFIVDERVKIPFVNIFGTLVGIIVPVGIGLLIQHKRPVWAQKISLVLRPFFIVLLLVVFTLGVWTNLYIFDVISPFLILAACLLPYCSFGLAALVAFICRQPKNRILTIAIETAIQNTGLPIIIMKLSLPQPEADLSAVSPVAIACFMPIPLWIAIGVMEVRRRWCLTSQSDAEPVPIEDVEDPKEEKNGNLGSEVVANGNQVSTVDTKI